MPAGSENHVHFPYRMPFGKITIESDGNSILRIALGDAEFDGQSTANAVMNECANQLLEYLAGKRSVFDVPIKYSGTDFQMRVWGQISRIPYSHTMSYREVAEAIGQPGSYKMVGSAVNQNPLPILIPAHRVIPEGGRVASGDEHAQLRAAFRELEQKYAL